MRSCYTIISNSCHKPMQPACGFVITNCVYLGFLGSEQAGEAVNVVYDAAGKLAKFQQQYTNVEIEQAMVFLLTVGSFIHSTFDMLIWYSMACFCFRPGGRFEVRTNWNESIRCLVISYV